MVTVRLIRPQSRGRREYRRPSFKAPSMKIIPLPNRYRGFVYRLPPIVVNGEVSVSGIQSEAGPLREPTRARNVVRGSLKSGLPSKPRMAPDS